MKPLHTSASQVEARWLAIHKKMQARAEYLVKQGVIVPKMARGRRVWVLRFVTVDDGGKRHRAIYIGGDDQPELLRRARLFLDDLRSQVRWSRELAAAARFAGSFCSLLKRSSSRLKAVGAVSNP